MYAKIVNLKKEVGITIKVSKQVAMQLNQLEILSYVTIMYWPVTVGSNTCSQMYVATNKAFFSSTFTQFNPYIG